MDSDGELVGLPVDAEWSLWVLDQCTRFGCLPEQLMNTDGGLFRMLEIEALVRGTDE